MFMDLTSLGYAIIVFAILIGVGSILLYNFGGVVGCPPQGGATNYTFFNTTANLCHNQANGIGLGNASPAGTAYTTTNYMLTNLGSTSGGLASWTPAIIALSIGLLFLGAFLGKGRKGKY